MSFASDLWKVVNGFLWLLKTCHIFKTNVNINEKSEHWHQKHDERNGSCRNPISKRLSCGETM